MSKRDHWQDEEVQGTPEEVLSGARAEDTPVVYLEEDEEPPLSSLRLHAAPPRKRGRSRQKAGSAARRVYTPEQRFLILDTWLRSGRPAKDFAPLVGVSKHSLYAWKKRFEQEGPAGLEDTPRASKGVDSQ